MKEVEAVIAYLLGAFFIIAAGWILAITVGWNLPYDILAQALYWLKVHPWEDVVLSACLLVVGILPFLRPRSQQHEQTFLTSSQLGEVRMTEPAMQDIIRRSAQILPGVQNVQPNLRQREDGLEVLVYVQLKPEFIIPDTAEKLQGKVKEDIELYTGIKVAEVKVLVRSLETARQSRVR